MKNRKLKKKTM